MRPQDFVIGQQLWFASNEHPRRDPCWVTITKIGRKWLSLENTQASDCRADIETLTVWAESGGMSCGQCYVNQSDREAVVQTEAAWKKLRDRIGYKIPAGLNAQTIQIAEELLFGEKPR